MYKTIVVHLSGAPSAPSTLGVAASLANTMGAHLIGAATSGIAELNYMLAVGTPVVIMSAADIDQLRDDAKQRLRAFQVHCREFGVASYETRLFDTAAADAMLLQSMYCDLLVAGCGELSATGLLTPAELPGALVTQAPRPVLLVPPSAPANARFDTIMIAWNGSAGISRTIALAMPLIARAARIVVGVCNPELDRIDAGSEPGADLATYLARHHGNVEVVRRGSNETTQVALVNLADEVGADLMLAGAFGHSRIREWVLGSTTMGLIEHTRIPLMMTH
jgi:nucleotide-binding universal stress UspA family protein